MAAERKEKELTEKRLKQKEIDLEMMQRAKDEFEQKYTKLQEELERL